MEKEEFFTNLYKGYAAEHFVASHLFERGFEVFRLPADFGFDLVVTNQFHVAKQSNVDASRFPFSLQVKGRWVTDSMINRAANGRREATVHFSVKDNDVQLIERSANSGLSIVSVWPEGICRGFWVDSAAVKRLRAEGFLRSSTALNPATGQPENNFVLTVKFHLRPTIAKADFVREIEQQFKPDQNLVEYLNKELPERFMRNWNANEYIRFFRDDKSSMAKGLVSRWVTGLDHDFSQFPNPSTITIHSS